MADNLIKKLSEVYNRGGPNFVTTHKGERKMAVGVDGYVHYVLGLSEPALTVGDKTIYQEVLSISLGNYAKDWGIRFRYNRETSLHEGDHITAGIIVNDRDEIEEAAYIAYWDNLNGHGRSTFQRVDYAREMNPTDQERIDILMS